MRPVERIMHLGIRDGKGMITRCFSLLPGVARGVTPDGIYEAARKAADEI